MPVQIRHLTLCEDSCEYCDEWRRENNRVVPGEMHLNKTQVEALKKFARDLHSETVPHGRWRYKVLELEAFIPGLLKEDQT